MGSPQHRAGAVAHLHILNNSQSLVVQQPQNGPLGGLLIGHTWAALGQMEKFPLDQCCVLSTLNLQGHCHLNGMLDTLKNAINPNKALWFSLYMLSETWRGERKGKKNRSSDIKSSNVPPACADRVVTSCLKPRPAFSQLSSEVGGGNVPVQRWWRMTKHCKSGPRACLLIAGVHRLRGGCPRWGLHIGWFLPVKEQNGQMCLLLFMGRRGCFAQKLLRCLSSAEGRTQG